MKILTILIFCLIPSIGFSDPLARFTPENVVGSVALKDKLVGTTWAYKWRGREYIFGFDSNGTISKLKSWSTVKWVVTASNEVVLEGISDRMILLFNDQAMGIADALACRIQMRPHIHRRAPPSSKTNDIDDRTVFAL